MNTLVFGGLIAVAVVAVIILVLVLMAEQKRPAKVDVAEQPTVAQAAVPVQTSAPAPVASTPKTTLPVTQPFDQDRRFNGSLPLAEATDTLALIRIRGQLREISNELHLLHRQSSAFEQRISALTEAANYVERMLVEQTSFEQAEETLS